MAPTNKLLTADIMKRALSRLDELIQKPVTLLVGGGGAMILAHAFPLSTTDIDAVPKGMDPSEIEPQVHQVATEQNLPHDWLNPYFSTFSYTLPSDYGSRLIEIFRGTNLSAQALGLNEMLIMKCYAHRQKDVGHTKALIKRGADTAFVEGHIEKLKEKGIPKSQDALDFLYDVLDQLEA